MSQFAAARSTYLTFCVRWKCKHLKAPSTPGLHCMRSVGLQHQVLIPCPIYICIGHPHCFLLASAQLNGHKTRGLEFMHGEVLKMMEDGLLI